MLVITVFSGAEGLLGVWGSGEEVASCSIFAQQVPLSQEA